jgi:formylmethanofuran dehydrogenase subunit E
MHSKNVRLRFIGVIHSPFKDAAQAPSQGRDAQGVIEVFEPYCKALKDIEGFSHIHLLYWLHKARCYSLIVRTPWDTEKHGLFATRSPHRINPIGYAVVELRKVYGRKLAVRGLDAVDGTPVIDIKPYISSIDTKRTGHNDWLQKTMRDRAHRAYILHMTLPRTTTIQIGKLGRHRLSRGHYYYVGSAKNNLHQRIARHRRKYKKRFWHIDHLLAHATIRDVYTSDLDEDRLARVMESLCQVPIKKFGASDSYRDAHLFFSSDAIVRMILTYTAMKKL